jgi:hypothetical protein
LPIQQRRLLYFLLLAPLKILKRLKPWFFSFQRGGKILWDYEIQSVPIYQYDESTKQYRQGLEILCVVLLLTSCTLELIGDFAC